MTYPPTLGAEARPSMRMPGLVAVTRISWTRSAPFAELVGPQGGGGGRRSAASPRIQTARLTRSRRSASRVSRPVPVNVFIAHLPARCPCARTRARRRSGAGTAPPGWAASWPALRTSSAHQPLQHRLSSAWSTLNRSRGAVDSGRARRAGRPAGRSAARSPRRSRYGSGAAAASKVPDSTVRPARTMLTRSHSASTSDRMWLDSSTVRPPLAAPRTHVLEDRLHQRVEARRSARRGGRARRRTANAATSATFCRLPLE